MHATAEQNARRFFNTYVTEIQNSSILEIGSQIGGFNIRSLAPIGATYTGVDLEPAPGVDVVLTDEYKLPFEDNTFDFVISSSCFEHIEFFWVSFLEIVRVLKPQGVFYLNAPSNGDFHRYPVDCWRFFPDSGLALAKWARAHNYDCELLEQYTSNKELDIWSDYVGVFIKDIQFKNLYPKRIIDTYDRFINGSTYPHNNFKNQVSWK